MPLFRGEVDEGGSVRRRAADARFLLPAPVATAAVVGSLPQWSEALAASGIEVLAAYGPTGAPVDLVVAPAARLVDAVPAGAMLVVEGRASGRELRRQGVIPTRVLHRRGPAGPRLLVPTGRRRVASYALTRWSAPPSRFVRWRNAVVARLVSAGTLPGRSVLTVASPSGGEPFLVAAARSLGVVADGGWFVSLGSGDDLQRFAFHLFRAGEDAPAWVLKAARVPGYDAPFLADEHGLSLAARHLAGRRHAPAFLGHLVAGGVHATVETAALGGTVHAELAGSAPLSRKLALVDSVAAWLMELATQSADDGAAEGERRRLREEVLPRWGVSPSLVDRTVGLPVVLQHNDLGPWNVTVGPPFCAFDWESARSGLPLWDLVYFLGYALLLIDGNDEEQDLLALFRGTHPHSDVLFGWVRRHVDAFGLPAAAVGPTVAMSWMHHGLSHGRRASALRDAGGAPTDAGPLDSFVRRWLADPLLGPTWAAWAERDGRDRPRRAKRGR